MLVSASVRFSSLSISVKSASAGGCISNYWGLSSTSVLLLVLVITGASSPEPGVAVTIGHAKIDLVDVITVGVGGIFKVWRWVKVDLAAGLVDTEVISIGAGEAVSQSVAIVIAGSGCVDGVSVVLFDLSAGGCISNYWGLT